MSDNPSSPLLGAHNPQERPSSQRSDASSKSKRSDQAIHANEQTSLLSQQDNNRNYGDAPPHDDSESPAASWLRHVQGRSESKGKPWRWPTIVALTLLTAVVLAILGLGFAAPAVVEEYAKEAMVFEPTALSIDSFTSTGVKARVQGDFTLDGSKVRRKPIRDLGRAATWIAAAVESCESNVKVYLPEYGNLLLGTAVIPPVVVSIRDGVTTHVDFISDLHAGDLDGLKGMAKDWIEGRIGNLKVAGVADVSLKSGIFGLGTQKLSETINFAGEDIPEMPQYNITKLNFRQLEFPSGDTGMAADVSLEVTNDYPVSFTVPPLGFEILVRDCDPDQPYIHFANAATKEIDVEPEEDVQVQALGLVEKLPDMVTRACPQTRKSPLDALVGDYIRGDETTVYVRGAQSPSQETPEWVSDLIQSVTVPVPFPGKTFGNLIRNFSLAEVHFGLPSPFADPKSPESHPRISATVKALVGLPQEMDFPISVAHVRANSTIYFHKKELGHLDLSEWQKANSTQIKADGDTKAGLAVESIVKDAPLQITDNDVFSEVVKALVFGNKPVILGVKADVDVETETALGKFVVRDIPAKGKVFVKPLSNGHNLSQFSPEVGSLQVLETTKDTLALAASVNITNPTPYSATIPFLNIQILSNSTTLGHVTATNLSIHPGNNTNLPITALWDPSTSRHGLAQSRELLSQYISGFNTSLTLRTHAGSIPSQPSLGIALSRFTIEIPTPHLSTPPNPNHPSRPLPPPGGGDDGEDPDDPTNRDPNAPKFIDDATFHILSSTATFTLLSPLNHNTLVLNYVNATALYNHTLSVGTIYYDYPFDVPPGVSQSPALPVEWDLGSVAFQALKEAVGGRLRLDARATVEVAVGEWTSGKIWFRGRGIGAGIRF